MNTLSKEEILNRIDGWRVGNPDGVIICDYCGARVQAQEDQEWQAYVTSPRGKPQPMHVLHVYCPDCDRTQNFPSTEGVDELIVGWNPRTQMRQPTMDAQEVLKREKP